MPINSFLYPGAKTTPAYEVANSCRFEDGDSPKMTITQGNPTEPGGNASRKWTISTWVKRGNLGINSYIFLGGAYTNQGNKLYFDSNDNLVYWEHNSSSTTSWKFVTNRKFRDCSAWYSIIVAHDSTQSTEGNRVKIYINGTQETSFSTDTYPSEDADSNFMYNAEVITIGAQHTQNYFDGYLAETVFIDGSQLAATSFGEFDEDSPTIWKPKDVSGLTFGTNGFYLDYEDSSNLGNDANGGTDLSETNLAATDQATDTPTNNFATWNPLAQTPQKGTIAEGNLEYDRAGGSDNWVTIASTIAATAGKWYYEYKIIDGGSSTGNGSLVGFLDYNTSAFQHTANDAITNAGEYAWYGASGNLYINGTDVAQVDSYTDDDIVMVAMDLDNSKAYWGKNGTWIDSGDPTSGATGTGARDIANVSSGTFAFAVSHREGGNGQANFGNPPFSISSGNADDNGYGNFEYDVPTGYLALCTKNLGSDGG